jgi:hypothetical protein
MNPKSNTKILILFCVVAVIIVGVLIYTQFDLATANWEVYRNGGYNYTLKYPKEWSFREFCEGEIDSEGYCEGRKPGFSLAERETQENPDDILNDDDINIYVFDRLETEQSLEEFVSRRDRGRINIESDTNKKGLKYLFYKDAYTPEHLQKAFFESEDYFILLELKIDEPNLKEKTNVYRKMINTLGALD